MHTILGAEPGEIALDRGGFGRLDISDLRGGGDEPEMAASPALCDWCQESRTSGDYLVVADNRHFSLCAICWGRSAGYVEMRHAGIGHDAALGKLRGE